MFLIRRFGIDLLHSGTDFVITAIFLIIQRVIADFLGSILDITSDGRDPGLIAGII